MQEIKEYTKAQKHIELENLIYTLRIKKRLYMQHKREIEERIEVLANELNSGQKHHLKTFSSKMNKL